LKSIGMAKFLEIIRLRSVGRRSSQPDCPCFPCWSGRLFPANILVMVIVRFPNVEMRRRALGCSLGRFSGRSWVTGEVLVPEPALPHLAAEGIVFSVEGAGTYDRVLCLNEQANPSATGEAAAKAGAFAGDTRFCFRCNFNSRWVRLDH
jgi:hypothetical protein